VSPRLPGKRVLILGAETEIGRAVTTAVAEAGASVAAVAAASDAEAAFAVQRLARGLSAERKVIAQAIDATNEAAVRVMVRQVSKELGGLNAVVYTLPQVSDVGGLRDTLTTHSFLSRFAGKELDRLGGGQIIWVTDFGPRIAVGFDSGVVVAIEGGRVPQWRSSVIRGEDRKTTDVAVEVVGAIAGEADSG
jgi:NAD(P)-dependent dehydrogenase (short-subunit alcohol dehydrogenase family)